MQITVNEPGARTINDARPMRIEGQNVYVSVGGGVASLIVACRTVATRHADSIGIQDAQAWAVDYRDELNAPRVALESAAAEVREMTAPLLDEADQLESHGFAPYRHTLPNGRVVRFLSSDPRHPSQRAAQLRRQAAVLAAWTAEDELGYKQYVSDGLGATDGYYAPLARDAWKSTLSA